MLRKVEGCVAGACRDYGLGPQMQECLGLFRQYRAGFKLSAAPLLRVQALGPDRLSSPVRD